MDDDSILKGAVVIREVAAGTYLMKEESNKVIFNFSFFASFFFIFIAGRGFSIRYIWYSSGITKNDRR